MISALLTNSYIVKKGCILRASQLDDVETDVVIFVLGSR